jgi:hypothetical protein
VTKPNSDDNPPEVTASPEGSGKKDPTAPVKGGELRPDGIDGQAVYDQLSPKAKEQFAKRWQDRHPDWIAAKKDARRERMRLFITIVVFVAIIAEAGVAVYLAAVAKSASWDTIKDWLTLVLAPLIAAATVASTFWFPSREAD